MELDIIGYARPLRETQTLAREIEGEESIHSCLIPGMD